jgi:hypothetical protein
LTALPPIGGLIVASRLKSEVFQYSVKHRRSVLPLEVLRQFYGQFH